MILVDSLPGFKAIFHAATLPAHWLPHVVAFVAAFLARTGPTMTVSEAATLLREHRRHVATLTRFLLDVGHSRNLLVCLQSATLMLEAELSGPGDFVFLLDATKRHSKALGLENSFSCANTRRTPRKDRKGKGRRKQYKSDPRRCHNFICGLLLTPGGLRIPFFKPYYTREHCEQIDRPFFTDAELAAQMVRELQLPAGARGVVVGDTAYDAEVLRQACRERSFPWVVPANPERVFEGRPDRFELSEQALAGLAKGRVPAEVLAKLGHLRPRVLGREEYVQEVKKALTAEEWKRHRQAFLVHGQHKRRQVRSLVKELSAEQFQPVRLSLGEGSQGHQRRLSASRGGPGKNPSRTYWVHQRIAEVHSVGEVVLLFSKKCQAREGEERKVDKILMSNALEASVEQLLGWYDLRWQIEQFFKECKSVLGLDHYRLKKFAQVEGWVELCLVSFCYLEWYRAKQLGRSDLGKAEREDWSRARSRRLCQRVRQRIRTEEAELMCRMMETKEGRAELAQALREVAAAGGPSLAA